MVLRGGSEQFIDEAERSLHDAIMIVRRAIKNSSVVAGGGAIDMEISRWGLSSEALFFIVLLRAYAPLGHPGYTRCKVNVCWGMRNLSGLPYAHPCCY